MILRIASALAATAASAVCRRVSAPNDIFASFGTASTEPTPLTVIESCEDAASWAPARSGSPTAPASATTVRPAATRRNRRFIGNLRYIGDEADTPPTAGVV